MVKLIKQGRYKLIETHKHTKVLYLDNLAYAWINAKRIGELLISSRKTHKTDCLLGQGNYRLYDVSDEPHLTDLKHLELQVNQDKWQGYLLLTSLPYAQKPEARIVPTHEVISIDRQFAELNKTSTRLALHEIK